nr:hypothetical protein [Tanacetum cinerariifolium]
IDSLLDEFAGKLTLIKSIPSRIDKTDYDPEEDIRLTKRLLYDNSSPRPPEEFVSENSNAETESFSPSPIRVEDSDYFMEEIDLSFNPDDPMPSGIEDDDYDSERDILIHEELLDNYSLSLSVIESYHFDIPPFSRPPTKPPDAQVWEELGQAQRPKTNASWEAPHAYHIPGNVETQTKGFYPPSLHFLSFKWESRNFVTNSRETPSWREIVSLTILVKLASFTENKLGWDDSAFSVFTTNSEDVEGRPIFHSDKSSEVNTNDFAFSDSSVKSSKHKPTDSTSCASTSSVSTSVNGVEIESNVGTPIKEPISVLDLPSFSCNSPDKNEHTSRTSCNKNGSFNKKADCDFHVKQMANKTVGIGVGSVHSRNKVHHKNQFVLQAVLLRTGKVNISPARPQLVPTGKPKVFAPVPTCRHNRPFPVPIDRGYSPSVSSGIYGQLLLSPQQVVFGNHIEKVYTRYPRTIVDLIHLHTDDNVADLLTKAFDGPRHTWSIRSTVFRVWVLANHHTTNGVQLTMSHRQERVDSPCGYVVPTGRVIVPTGRYVVPTSRVIVATGRYVVPAGGHDDGGTRKATGTWSGRSLEDVLVNVSRHYESGVCTHGGLDPFVGALLMLGYHNSKNKEEGVKEDESGHNKERYTFEDDDDDGEFDDLD